MSKVIVIGGGPAGMMAAYAAACQGHHVTLLEQNEKLGKKLFITGKGRCNITNASDMDHLFANVMSNRKFLYSAFYTFDNEQVIAFFEEQGLRTKVERGNRVFPVSDHSSDVIAALSRALRAKHVEILLHTRVEKLLVQDACAYGVILSDGKRIEADAVIVATGGISYPSTGATGDGYRMALESGHHLVESTPSLVPFETKEAWVKELQGLSLRNVTVSIYNGKKKLYEDFGEMLFTHFGVSGPVILSASSVITGIVKERPVRLSIDLKPAITDEQLDERILRDFSKEQNKAFKNSLDELLPKKLIPVIVMQSGIKPEKKVNEVTREERQRLVKLLKNFDMTVTSTRGFNEAIITQGGVNVKEINPSTMESKLVKNIYFAGEVIDVDAVTGGFNLQVAWSTAYAAASHIQ